MGASTHGDGDDGSIASINVTPMVDLTLVLLIIFMVAAPLLSSASSIKVNLPKAVDGGDDAVVAADAHAGAAAVGRAAAVRQRPADGRGGRATPGCGS